MNVSQKWDGLTKSIENSNVAHRSFRLKSLQDIHAQDINKMSILTERSQQQRVRTASSSDNDASSGIVQKQWEERGNKRVFRVVKVNKQ